MRKALGNEKPEFKRPGDLLALGDEIFEVIRIIFFTCGVTKLLPTLKTLCNLFEPVS